MTDAPKGWQCVNKPEISTGHQQTRKGMTTAVELRAGDVTGTEHFDEARPKTSGSRHRQQANAVTVRRWLRAATGTNTEAAAWMDTQQKNQGMATAKAGNQCGSWSGKTPIKHRLVAM